MKTKTTGQLLRVVKRQPRTRGLSSVLCCVSWLMLFALMLQGAGCPLAAAVYAAVRGRTQDRAAGHRDGHSLRAEAIRAQVRRARLSHRAVHGPARRRRAL